MRRVLHLVFGPDVPEELESLPDGDGLAILGDTPEAEESSGEDLSPEDVVGLIFEHDVVVTW